MRTITSKNNEFIKKVKKLQQKKYRQQYRLFILEGVFNFQELVRRKEMIETVIFLENENKEMYQDFTQTHPQVDSVLVNQSVMKFISEHKTTPGIMTIVKLPSYKLTDVLADKSFLIYLDRIRDPGNLGAIIRSGWALGADGLLLNEGCADPFSGKTARASMGGILDLPIVSSVDQTCLNVLKQKGYQIIAAGSTSDSKEYHRVDYSDKVLLVIGNESAGISSDIMNLADERVHIRMYKQADSLNAASACAIIAAEVSYQRNNDRYL